jgi:hypothetical protein
LGVCGHDGYTRQHEEETRNGLPPRGDKPCVRSETAAAAERVYLALKRQGLRCHRITLKRALARLHGLGVLRNSRHRPRGYSLDNDSPLFQRPRQQ